MLREMDIEEEIVRGVVQRQLMGRWDEAINFRCTLCHRVSIHHAGMSYHCRVTGCYDGDHHLGPVGTVIDDVWTGAKNTIQWQPVPKRNRS
jgi:hypothetical protein